MDFFSFQVIGFGFALFAFALVVVVSSAQLWFGLCNQIDFCYFFVEFFYLVCYGTGFVFVSFILYFGCGLFFSFGFGLWQS